MRTFFTVITGMVLFSGLGLAQDDNVTTATDALQDGLANLKYTVERLSLDNDQLAASDIAMKGQASQLQMQLEHAQEQGDLLNKAAARLKDQNPHRARQIARLEAENFDLDNRTRKAQLGIKLVQQSLEAGYEEDQKLLLQLKNMTMAVQAPTPSPESRAEAHDQKEKLELMKMIYDSQQRQESLHEAILSFQKNTPLLPAADALARQQLLKGQIKDLETQIAAYPPGKFEVREQSSGVQSNRAFWDASQLRQLELELKALERNYAQLKDLVEKMTKKAQSARLTVSEHVEEVKLQGTMEDLNHQGVELRVGLDELRSQMVDLDKRKSHLEEMIQQLP